LIVAGIRKKFGDFFRVAEMAGRAQGIAAGAAERRDSEGRCIADYIGSKEFLCQASRIFWWVSGANYGGRHDALFDLKRACTGRRGGSRANAGAGLRVGRDFFDRILLPSRRSRQYTIGNVPLYVQEFRDGRRSRAAPGCAKRFPIWRDKAESGGMVGGSSLCYNVAPDHIGGRDHRQARLFSG